MIWPLAWGIPAILIFVGFIGWLGYTDGRDGESFETAYIAILAFMLSAIWPIVLAAAVISSPYWVGRLSGGYKKKKYEKYVESLEDKIEALKALRDQFKKTEPEWEVLTEMLEEANYQYGTA